MKLLSFKKIAAVISGALVALTGIAFATIPASADATGYATTAVNVRSGTSTGTSVLTTIPSGAQINVQCQVQGQSVNGTYSTNWWARVSYNGKTGYASRAYIRIPNASGLGSCSTSSSGGTTSTSGVTGYTTDWVNQRAQTTTSSTLLGTLAPNTRVTVQCQTTGQTINGTYNSNWWARVNHNGKTGYVSRAYVRIPNATGLGNCTTGSTGGGGTSLSANRQQVINNARYWTNQGVPYSMTATWRGADGRQYRRDCSGMVAQAYGIYTPDLYLNTPSTVTLSQWFYPIAKDSLLPGDIIGNLGGSSGGAAGHVVIFNGWANASRTSFYTLESTGDNGRAIERTRSLGTSFWNKQAWRRNGW